MLARVWIRAIIIARNGILYTILEVGVTRRNHRVGKPSSYSLLAPIFRNYILPQCANRFMTRLES